MTPENTYKKIVQGYLDKIRRHARLSCKRGSNTVVVHGWPSTQGQGIAAAGAVADQWGKLKQLARANGFNVTRPGEY